MGREKQKEDREENRGGIGWIMKEDGWIKGKGYGGEMPLAKC